MHPISFTHAIETAYKGHRFRSRLEARWAVFFDSLGVPWEYEKEGYEIIHHGRYLPDFFLPTVYLRTKIHRGTWLEVKPKYPEEEFDKFHALGTATGNAVVVAAGTPTINGLNVADEQLYQLWPWYDQDMQWMFCANCFSVKIDYCEGHHMYCAECEHPTKHGDDRVISAIYAARGARFEYGEYGIVLTK
jgi:hypothetical protein